MTEAGNDTEYDATKHAAPHVCPDAVREFERANAAEIAAAGWQNRAQLEKGRADAAELERDQQERFKWAANKRADAVTEATAAAEQRLRSRIAALEPFGEATHDADWGWRDCRNAVLALLDSPEKAT